MATPARARTRTRSNAQEGSSSRSSVKKKSSEIVSESPATNERIPSMVEDPNAAFVTVGARDTRNLGNFESIQIHASVTLPCEPNDEAVLAAGAKCSELANELMRKEFDEQLEGGDA